MALIEAKEIRRISKHRMVKRNSRATVANRFSMEGMFYHDKFNAHDIN